MKVYLKSKWFDELSKIELYSILKLRNDVFIVEQNCAFLDIDGKDFVAKHLFITNDQDEILAYSRIFDLNQYFENFCSIGRVITNKEYRNNGLGNKILNFSLEEIEKNFGKKPIKIGAQCYLQKFYENFGFKIIGDAYLEDGILHNFMIKK